MSFRRVTSGERRTPSRRAHNLMYEGASRALRETRDGGLVLQRGDVPTFVSGWASTDVERFQVFKLSTAAISAANNLAEFQNRRACSLANPAWPIASSSGFDRVVVALESFRNNTVGTVAVAGVVPCKVDLSEEGIFARPINGDADKMRRDWFGFKIVDLGAADEEDVAWCLIDLNEFHTPDYWGTIDGDLVGTADHDVELDIGPTISCRTPWFTGSETVDGPVRVICRGDVFAGVVQIKHILGCIEE